MGIGLRHLGWGAGHKAFWRLEAAHWYCKGIVQRSRGLVFDEATSALDYETEKEVMKSIHNSNRDLTLLIVAHRLSTLQQCDRIIELSHGEIKRQCSYSDILD